MDVTDVFFDAIRFARPEERRIFLDQACGESKQRRNLETLLEIHDSIPDSAVAETTTDDGSPDGPSAETAHVKFTPSEYSGSWGRLGRYEIVQILAVGGMSVVLEAFDPYLTRLVAIKVLSAGLCQFPRARQRFQREAQLAAAIDHPNVAKIFAVDQQDNVPYLVMEFIRGQTLTSRIQEEGRLTVQEILRIGSQAAHGLAAIHDSGLLHRDIKPDNVLLEFPRQVAKITDFGVARADDDHRLTRTGELIGTPQFMSPEQAQGLAVDQRSDLFSFGSLLYAMACGHSPFEAETPLACMRRVCDDAPPKISQLRSDLPDWVAEAISQLLEKAPKDRRLTARGLANLFASDADAEQAVRHRAANSKTRPKRIVKFVKVAIFVAVCLAILAVGLVATVDSTLTRRLRYAWYGYGQIFVEVDGPDVQITVVGRNTFLQKDGSFQAWLKPGKYEFQSAKNGRGFHSQRLSLKAWEEKVIVVNSADSSVSTRTKD